jgi:hypothetical protein
VRLADALRLFAGSDLDCVAISEAADELDRLTADLAAERAEVERLRDGRVRLASKIIDRAADEIVRLRAAGDALAEALDDWPELVAAWNEARNA